MTAPRHDHDPTPRSHHRVRRALAVAVLAIVPTVVTVAVAPAAPVAAAACARYTNAADLPMRLCSSGELVRALQQRLNRANPQQIAVDGYFGPATDASVREFQRNNGLEVDGIVGPRTWFLVTQLGVSCEWYTTATDLPMRRCQDGLLVARLQQLLQETGVGAPPVSGRFGPETMAAVMRFQRVYGIPATGVVDNVTWWVLHTH